MNSDALMSFVFLEGFCCFQQGEAAGGGTRSSSRESILHSISDERWGNVLEQIDAGYHNTTKRELCQDLGSHLTDEKTLAPGVRGCV